MAPNTAEPTVSFHAPMPAGYRFLAKGNVYMTANCRRRTQDVGGQVYVVVDRKGRQTGIRCPSAIILDVATDERATRSARAGAVRKKDETAAAEFRDALLGQFPRVPRDVVPQITRHALVKKKKRVARTATLGLRERVGLAVRAHIRHCHTGYDKLLKDGLGREEARAKVWPKMLDVAGEWAGRARRPEAVAGRRQPASGAKTAAGRLPRRASLESARKTRELAGNQKPSNSRKSPKQPQKKVSRIGQGRRGGGGGRKATPDASEDYTEDLDGFIVMDDDSDGDWEP